jgi:biotin operon repressor
MNNQNFNLDSNDEEVKQPLQKDDLISDSSSQIELYDADKEASSSSKETTSADEKLGDNEEITEEVSSTYSTAEAPAGYKRIKEISIDFGLSLNSIKKIIRELGDDLGDSKIYKYKIYQLEHYSPEQIEMIRKKAEEMRFFEEPAPDNYKSLKGIEELLGISKNNLEKIIDSLGEELGEVKEYRFLQIAKGYSPSQIEKIENRAKEMNLDSEPAPEYFINASEIIRRYGIDHSSFKIILKILQENEKFGEVKKYKFGKQVKEGFSPLQAEMIRQLAQDRGIFNVEAPEGYLSLSQLNIKTRLTNEQIKALVDKYTEKIGKVNKYKFNGPSSLGFSPTQAGRIIGLAKEEGLIRPARSDEYKSARGIALELGVAPQAVRSILTEIQDELGLVIIENYPKPTKSFSPEQQEIIKRKIQEKKSLGLE